MIITNVKVQSSSNVHKTRIDTHGTMIRDNQDKGSSMILGEN